MKNFYKCFIADPAFVAASSDWQHKNVHFFTAGIERDRTTERCTMYDAYLVIAGFRLTVGFFVIKPASTYPEVEFFDAVVNMLMDGSDKITHVSLEPPAKPEPADWRSVLFMKGKARC